MLAQRSHTAAEVEHRSTPLRIAVLVPCFNEAASIGKVVTDFRTHLPSAQIYVYDNMSTDDTSLKARQAGAIVCQEGLRGKGNVLRRMFADVEADIYVLVDGDDTYDASSAPLMIEKLTKDSLDVVNGARVAVRGTAFRPGHKFGNRMLTGLVAWIFGSHLTDMLSGYRVMSRRFVKSFPALSSGFEIETELSVHALELRLPMCEIATDYRERGQGSTSKLHTVRDGIRILRMIGRLVKDERPLPFFSIAAAILLVAALALGWPIVKTYLVTGQVPRLPTAVLATGLVIMSSLSFLAGVILETVTRGRRELKRLLYLSLGASQRDDNR